MWIHHAYIDQQREKRQNPTVLNQPHQQNRYQYISICIVLNISKFMYPLLLKILLHGQEPLEHKGGRLIPLWKGKLSQGLCEAYRSILISSHVGKFLHRTIRIKQATVYKAYLQNQQIGGQRKAPVVLGVHAARAFIRLHHDRNRPCALLFLDLTEAFYRVLRPLALEGICQDKVLAAMAQRLNLGPHILADLHQHLQAPCATARAGLPSHLGRALRALHLDTHTGILENNRMFVGPQQAQGQATPLPT